MKYVNTCMFVFRLTEHFPRISEILSTEVVGKKDLICRAAFVGASVPLYSNIKDYKIIFTTMHALV